MPKLLLLLLVPWPMRKYTHHCSRDHLHDLKNVRLPHRRHLPGICRAFYQYGHRGIGSRHRETVSFKACSNWSSWYLFPVAASIMFLSLASSSLFWKKTRQEAVQETEEVLRRNPQYEVLVFHSMSCPSLSSRNSNSNWTMCWSLHPNCRHIPSLLLDLSRTSPMAVPPCKK